MKGNTVGSRLGYEKDIFYAYLSGFLDGDGCIAIKFEKSKTNKLRFRARVRVSFTQRKSRRKVLDYLRGKIGSGVVTEYSHNNMSEYVINDQTVIENLLNEIEPYIFVKTKQLTIAKKLLLLKKNGYSHDSIEKMHSLWKEMGSLNNYPKESSLTP